MINPALVTAFSRFQALLETLSDELATADLFGPRPGTIPAASVYEQGRHLLARGEIAEAALAFAETITAEPDHLRAHFRLVSACQMLGAPILARRFYETALQGWPNWEEGQIVLGTLFEEMGALPAAQALMHPDFSRRAAFAGRIRDEIGGELGLTDLPLRIITSNMVRSAGFAGYLDTYLKAGILGLRPNHPVILLAPEEWIAMPAMLDKWRRHIHIITDKTAIHRLAPLKSVIEDRPDWEIEIDGRAVYVEDAMTIIQRRWEDEGRAPLLAIEPEEHQRGWDILAGFGMPRGAWFVTAHLREPGYWGWAIGDSPRNVDVASYFPAIREITDRGGWVVRIGDPKMTPLPPMERVIDYALSDVRSPWLDLFLIAGSRFFLGSNSGPALFAQIFGIPAILSNWTWDRGPRSGRDLCLPKLWRDKASGRILTFAETQSPHLRGTDGQIYHDQGIEMVDNTPDELRAATVEMLDRPDPAKDQDRQDQALARLRAANPGFAMNGRFGRYWLERHFGALTSAGQNTR
jgi:putative glycosyltransferase (TIGR04372 family)